LEIGAERAVDRNRAGRNPPFHQQHLARIVLSAVVSYPTADSPRSAGPGFRGALNLDVHTHALVFDDVFARARESSREIPRRSALASVGHRSTGGKVARARSTPFTAL
jgi:hypothetical protein